MIENPFVGHIGGDDFIVIINPVRYNEICEKILQEFDTTVTQYFEEKELDLGCFEVPNRLRRNRKISTYNIKHWSNRGRSFENQKYSRNWRNGCFC